MTLFGNAWNDADCYYLDTLYSIIFGGWREQSSPHPTNSLSDLMHQRLGLPKLRRWQTVLLLLQDSNWQKLDVDVILGNVFVVI